jgi:hypothetical protein
MDPSYTSRFSSADWFGENRMITVGEPVPLVLGSPFYWQEQVNIH